MRQNFATMKLMLITLILGCFFYGCKNKELPSEFLSHISVVRETEGSPSAPQTHPASPADESSVAPTVPVQRVPHVKYHVIVASFGYADKARAEKMVSRLKEKNYPATIISSSQRYRVSIESFPTESEANTARDEYRDVTDRQDIWVHKVE